MKEGKEQAKKNPPKPEPVREKCSWGSAMCAACQFGYRACCSGQPLAK